MATFGVHEEGPSSMSNAVVSTSQQQQLQRDAERLPLAVSTPTSTLPGSWTARPERHGAIAVDSVRSSPESRAVRSNNSPPEDETNDSRAESRTRPATGLRFTCGVPSTRVS